MASLMEELMSTLVEEERLYAKLIPIEEEKTRAIVGNDLKKMQAITDQERGMVDETTALEAKREEIAVNIATVLGKNPKTITLDEIEDSLKRQPEDRKKLQSIHDALRKTVSRLRAVNEQNKELLQESMDMVEFNMNVMRSAQMTSGSSNYGSNASEVDGMAPTHPRFDATQ
ncbi:MAG: flagellar protein FlgN [Eubacterium sp.]|nr:flagellar protein FlgN [Eubacterium sp.]